MIPQNALELEERLRSFFQSTSNELYVRISFPPLPSGVNLRVARGDWKPGTSENKPTSVPTQFQRRNLKTRRKKERYTSVVNGELVGHKLVTASADTGASLNTISATLTEELGLTPDSQRSRTLKIASGAVITTLGTVSLKWQFAGERGVHDIEFDVVSKCVTDVVVGLKFLRVTETLTRFKHRIQKIFSSMRPGSNGSLSLNLVQLEQQRLNGLINGEKATVLPDSGANEKFISYAFSRKHGLKVHTESQYQKEVEFLDGSRAQTLGLVKKVPWQFRKGESPVECDFYVLEYLAVDVVMDNSLIDEYDVFEEYEDCLGDLDRPNEWYGVFVEGEEVFAIRMLENGEQDQTPEEEYRTDMTSPSPFSADMIRRELRRRGRIKLRNNKLSGDDKSKAENEEQDRIREWLSRKQEYESRQGQFSSRSIQSGTAPCIIPPNSAAADRRETRATRKSFGAKLIGFFRRREKKPQGIDLEAFPGEQDFSRL